MRKIKILIAEDHAVVRQGLRILIQADPDLEVVGEADNGQVAVDLALRLLPDVILMDISMPVMNGVEATRLILEHAPQCRILVLSSYSEDGLVQTLLDTGARGYITKHSASEELLEGVRQVYGGKRYFSQVVLQRLKRRGRKAFEAGDIHACDLTAREKEVLKLIAEGLLSKIIADRLGLSVKTVEKHRQSLMNKLDIHEIAGLTRYAASHGLLNAAPRATPTPEVPRMNPVVERPPL